jgi:hypothetical protein
MPDGGPTFASHPDVPVIAPAVQFATAVVLLEEGVERGQDLGHEARRYHKQ